ncbi:MAG: hydrogenase maturation protease [Acidimicrobiales bacterium]
MILVAGIGNVFLTDDGFGPEVARRFVESAPDSIPEGVKVVDFGIRGLHLAFELLDGYDLLILVDTVSRGDPPGTITVLEADPASDGGGIPDAHDMNPQNVLDLLADFGGSVGRVLVVGCEVANLDEGMGLTEPVAAAVGAAVQVVRELIEEERSAYAGKER